MGDRALIQFEHKGELSPCIYLHWGGSNVPEYLRDCRRLMDGRHNDLSYVAARFVGVVHSRNPKSNLSLGMWNQSERLTADDSHGDAGCFVVVIDDPVWQVQASGGYGKSGEIA